MGGRARCGAAAAFSAALLAGCTATADESGAPSTSSGTATAGLQTSVIGDVTLRHPAAWRLVPVPNRAAGPSSAIAYLTDQLTVAQCQTNPDGDRGTVMTCGSPVSTLATDGVFVRFVGEYLVPTAPTSWNRRLDGHLATVGTVSPDAHYCPTGASDALEVRVFVPGQHVEPPGSGHNVDMVACYAGPEPVGFQQEIDAVIDSMRFG